MQPTASFQWKFGELTANQTSRQQSTKSRAPHLEPVPFFSLRKNNSILSSKANGDHFNSICKSHLDVAILTHENITRPTCPRMG